MEKWSCQTALVTGASAGIGAAICSTLVKSGLKVVGAARSLDKIKNLADELKDEKGELMAVRCDLTKDDDIYALFNTIKKTYGGVDICINNAGLAFNKSLLGGSPEEWRQVINVNVIALCLCTKLAVASMRERGIDDGHVINISSISGHVVLPAARTHFYSGTKHAVRAITEGLRQELSEIKSHIRISSISPGLVETEFHYRVYKDPHFAKSLYSSLSCLQADDIASTVLHIISSPPHVEINDVIVRPTDQSF